MNGNEVCFCGDVADEHGHDPEYPGSTACTIEGCGCLAFEEDVEATEAHIADRPKRYSCEECLGIYGAIDSTNPTCSHHPHGRPLESVRAPLKTVVKTATKKPKPTKKGKKTLHERIDEALGGKPATCYELAMRLWPPRTNPRAWGCSTRGGPSAWSRTLMAGIRRGGFRTNIKHAGPSGTEVLPRTERQS